MRFSRARDEAREKHGVSLQSKLSKLQSVFIPRIGSKKKKILPFEECREPVLNISEQVSRPTNLSHGSLLTPAFFFPLTYLLS